MGRSNIRFGSIAGVAALAVGGLTFIGGPASAQDFDGIATFGDFLDALDIANGNGEPDTIRFALPDEVTWEYGGTLTVEDDLTLELEPGSASPTFVSTDASAFTITAGVAFTANSVGFTGLGNDDPEVLGYGIDATLGADVVLRDVRLSGSTNAGIAQTGGTLDAAGVVAEDNVWYGLLLEALDAVTLTDVTVQRNLIGGRIDSSSGIVLVTGLTANRNAGSGMELVAAGGTVEVMDSRFERNGETHGPLGGGVSVSASGGAQVAFTNVTWFRNYGVFGGGLYVESLLDDGTLVEVLGSVLERNGAGYGGAIGAGYFDEYALGSGTGLSIRDTAIVNNGASEGGGLFIGGALADSIVELVRTSIEGNNATSSSGGFVIGGFAGRLLIDSSTIAANTAEAEGGGGLVVACEPGEASADTVIVDSTVSGNAAPEGPGVYIDCADGEVAIDNSTITENASEIGAAVALFASGGSIRNTIIGGNPSDFDIELAIPGITIDYSLVQKPLPGLTTASLNAGSGNITGQIPDLEPLADNGGPTLTHLPVAGGNVVGAGDPDFVPPPEFDQRGEPRVYEVLDIGSVELHRPPHVLPVTGRGAPWWLTVAAGLLIVGGAILGVVRLLPRR